ncbi:MAG: alpha/beta hydrolase [Acidimicrobiia bacterium]|nr:MAG: alpha/beta hydrolase [Acidimicrobiia bacterium]
MKISYDGGITTAIEYGEPGGVGVLLAHGAGVGQDHPWMTSVANGLAAQGLCVMTFNYRYAEAGRKSPDRLPTLLEVHRAAADTLAERCQRVVLAGKSMGGRVGSHLAGDEGWPAAGLVYYGYPLVAMGKTEPRPTDHLERIGAPQVFFAGTRDRLGPSELIETVVSSLVAATVIVVEDGDHSFRVPKRAEKSNEQVLGGIVEDTAAWIEEEIYRPGTR